jgi:hypothetical protein
VKNAVERFSSIYRIEMAISIISSQPKFLSDDDNDDDDDKSARSGNDFEQKLSCVC